MSSDLPDHLLTYPGDPMLCTLFAVEPSASSRPWGGGDEKGVEPPGIVLRLARFSSACLFHRDIPLQSVIGHPWIASHCPKQEILK